MVPGERGDEQKDLSVQLDQSYPWTLST